MRLASLAIICMGVLVYGAICASEAPDEPVEKKDKSGAPDARFIRRHEAFINDIKKSPNCSLLLVGDFLTDDWRGTNKNGVKAIFDTAFGKYSPVNLGQGGDYTQNVFWRLQNGELEGINPKVMMLLIGGTNGSNGDDPQKIAAAIEKIIGYSRKKIPGMKIVLLTVPPFGEKGGMPRARHTAVNPILLKLADGENIIVVDLYPKYLMTDGSVNKELMPDGVHFSDKGYQIWADSVAEPLKALLAK